MTLVKFNQRPFEKSFNSIFEDLFQHFPATGANTKDWSLNGNAPVNINETKEAYQLDVVAPGFDKADFKINVDQNILTISGEKKTAEKTEGEKQIRKEYGFKSFKRSFTLDEAIDDAGISAKYENGVLNVTLPKKEEVKVTPKEISVQ
ncbi:Hsp20/alpha crystallin family protein [Pollutibacter soli]|uniref:Hsp20/alpha crystallin family protein n=1 Tax=Pollutibacter soli TaxID=3034157 RepID=UPI003014194A